MTHSMATDPLKIRGSIKKNSFVFHNLSFDFKSSIQIIKYKMEKKKRNHLTLDVKYFIIQENTQTNLNLSTQKIPYLQLKNWLPY